jgi:hypothetical protein
MKLRQARRSPTGCALKPALLKKGGDVEGVKGPIVDYRSLAQGLPRRRAFTIVADPAD